MEPDLDELLRISAPTLSRRDDALRAGLNAMISEAEARSTARRRRRSRKALGMGLGLALAVGVGTGASASDLFGLVPQAETGDWLADPGTIEHDFELASGETCTVTYAVEPETMTGLAKLRAGMAASEWSDALDEAKEAVRDFDESTFDVESETERYRREARATRSDLRESGVAASELSPLPSADLAAVLALGDAILGHVRDRLRAAKYDPDLVSIVTGQGCEGLQ